VLKIQDPRIENIRQHLQRYRDLTSQGKWADAGRELEAIQNEVQK
jgi:septation ring formation regulator EzrA